MSAEPQDVVARWIRGGETADAAMSASALADDAELVSPITEQFTLQGREEIHELLEAVFAVLSQYRVAGRTTEGRQVVIASQAVVGGRALFESQHLELDADGLIRRITLYIRPLTGLTALLRALGPEIARRQGRGGTARVLAAAGALLDGVASSGDARLVPMGSPERTRHRPT